LLTSCFRNRDKRCGESLSWYHRVGKFRRRDKAAAKRAAKAVELVSSKPEVAATALVPILERVATWTAMWGGMGGKWNDRRVDFDTLNLCKADEREFDAHIDAGYAIQNELLDLLDGRQLPPSEVGVKELFAETMAAALTVNDGIKRLVFY
jgi:hypothetical protein